MKKYTRTKGFIVSFLVVCVCLVALGAMVNQSMQQLKEIDEKKFNHGDIITRLEALEEAGSIGDITELVIYVNQIGRHLKEIDEKVFNQESTQLAEKNEEELDQKLLTLIKYITRQQEHKRQDKKFSAWYDRMTVSVTKLSKDTNMSVQQEEYIFNLLDTEYSDMQLIWQRATETGEHGTAHVEAAELYEKTNTTVEIALNDEEQYNKFLKMREEELARKKIVHKKE